MLKLLTFLLLIPLTAFAQNEENTIFNDVPSIEKFSKTYSPDFCEFEVSFPSEPYIARKCESPDRCYDLVSYTQVYEMASTVNFRVICNPIGEEILSAYTPEVMKATLKAMTKQSVVQEFNTTYREEETYKQAGLVGEGLSGRTPTIYIAQLWIGKQSALSVEAELIGEPMIEADTLFRDVLAGVQVKSDIGETTEDEAGENAQSDDSSPSAE